MKAYKSMGIAVLMYKLGVKINFPHIYVSLGLFIEKQNKTKQNFYPLFFSKTSCPHARLLQYFFFFPLVCLCYFKTISISLSGQCLFFLKSSLPSVWDKLHNER